MKSITAAVIALIAILVYFACTSAEERIERTASEGRVETAEPPQGAAEAGAEIRQEAGEAGREVPQAAEEASRDARVEVTRTREEVREEVRESGARVAEEIDQTGRDLDQAFERAGDELGDAALVAKIKAKYALDDHVKATRIDVDYSDGVVTLSGVVFSEEARARAEQLARDTAGVQRVVNNIKVAR